jgi:hypothetical protein
MEGSITAITARYTQSSAALHEAARQEPTRELVPAESACPALKTLKPRH